MSRHAEGCQMEEKVDDLDSPSSYEDHLENPSFSPDVVTRGSLQGLGLGHLNNTFCAEVQQIREASFTILDLNERINDHESWLSHTPVSFPCFSSEGN